MQATVAAVEERRQQMHLGVLTPKRLVVSFVLLHLAGGLLFCAEGGFLRPGPSTFRFLVASHSSALGVDEAVRRCLGGCSWADLGTE